MLYSKLTTFLAPYYNKNDVGHDYNHAKEVALLAVKMNDKYSMWPNNIDVIIAGLVHDVAIWKGIENHHTDGKILLEESEVFDNICIQHNLSKAAILSAVEEHRASFKGKHTTGLSTIISAADRGYPDAVRILKRLKSIGNEEKWSIDFVRKKYAGYAVYPDIYKDYFGDTFIEFQRQCHDKVLLKKIWDSL